jgi:hypothetical protein
MKDFAAVKKERGIHDVHMHPEQNVKIEGWWQPLE